MKSPLEHTKEDLAFYFDKRVKITLLEPIIFKNPDYATEELLGYFYRISLASNSPNLPMIIEFCHEKVDDTPVELLEIKSPIKINIFKIKSIETLP